MVLLRFRWNFLYNGTENERLSYFWLYHFASLLRILTFWVFRMMEPNSIFGFLWELLASFTYLSFSQAHSAEGGYLFAVVNPLDTVVQFGLRVHPSQTSESRSSHSGKNHRKSSYDDPASHLPKIAQNITLYWTDSTRQISSQVLLDLEIPSTLQHWTRLALALTGSC